ncbi:MAG: glycosyltransferase family 4 protein, partial [Hyphomicrobiaceae bacterium]|nr:glycosyltransferase family 4 protein [Hyphomicrobiaceae bacterium]
MQAGGAELGCLQIAEALVRAGHRALVASAGGRMVAALEAAGACHIALPLATKNPLRLWRNAQALAAIVRREDVDILHARSRAPAWSTLWAGRSTGVPFITTYHSEYSERGRIKRLYNSVMVRGDKVIAVSDHMAGLIAARYGTESGRIAIIHRAVDLARFDPAAVGPERLAAMRKLLGLQNDHAVVLLAARITRRKAQAHLVEAAGLLRQRGVEGFTCVFAGEIEKRDYMAEIEVRVRELGLQGRMRFPGNLADMPAAYLLADVSLNISEAEGLPRVVLESQAMGVPVIISDSGPGREAALTEPDAPPQAATGLRVPFGQPEALADALDALLSWPRER